MGSMYGSPLQHIPRTQFHVAATYALMSDLNADDDSIQTYEYVFVEENKTIWQKQVINDNPLYIGIAKLDDVFPIIIGQISSRPILLEGGLQPLDGAYFGSILNYPVDQIVL